MKLGSALAAPFQARAAKRGFVETATLPRLRASRRHQPEVCHTGMGGLAAMGISLLVEPANELGFESTATRDLESLPEEQADETLSLSAGRAVPANDRGTGRRELNGACREKILALYDEYRPRLFRYLGSMHVARDSSDEVIQETFMRLTMELQKSAEIENVQGWIVRVAHNLAIDLLKKQKRPALSSETATFVLENQIDPALSPEEAYSEKEQSCRVKLALTSLKPLHRECFEMRAHGFRYKDIGRALGISEQRAAFVVKQAAVRLAAICG